MFGKHYMQQYYPHVSRPHQRRRRVKVIYEQPKMIIVRRYMTTFIPHTNPDQYRKQHNKALLETHTLLEWCRRLKIPERLVNRIKNTIDFYFINSNF
jgi:hypothetical protein